MTAPDRRDDVAEADELLTAARRNVIAADHAARDTAADRSAVAVAQAALAQALFAGSMHAHAAEATRHMREVRAEDVADRAQRDARDRAWFEDVVRRAYDLGHARSVVEDGHSDDDRERLIRDLLDEVLA